MQNNRLITVQEFCTQYQIEFSFIDSLNQYGLIEVVKVEETPFINMEQLTEIEKMIRLHYELDINIEGIEAIYNLLKRVENMQEELNSLKNKLRLYEND